MHPIHPHYLVPMLLHQIPIDCKSIDFDVNLEVAILWSLVMKPVTDTNALGLVNKRVCETGRATHRANATNYVAVLDSLLPIDASSMFDCRPESRLFGLECL